MVSDEVLAFAIIEIRRFAEASSLDVEDDMSVAQSYEWENSL